jgi:hypothetical protein
VTLGQFPRNVLFNDVANILTRFVHFARRLEGDPASLWALRGLTLEQLIRRGARDLIPNAIEDEARESAVCNLPDRQGSFKIR